MSEHAHAEHAGHPPRNYVRIWAILCGLLVVSVIGPMVGIKILTLVTAFGVALVKAYLVARNFMHLDVEKPWVHYLLVTCLVFMVLLFAGVSPDVMKHQGARWTNEAAEAEVKRGEAAAHGEHAAPGAGEAAGHGAVGH